MSSDKESKYESDNKDQCVDRSKEPQEIDKSGLIINNKKFLAFLGLNCLRQSLAITSVDFCKGPSVRVEVEQLKFLKDNLPVENAIKVFDPVNKPKHYNSHPSGVQCIEIARHMNFNLGNAMKYIWRADEKGNTIEDLEKARWYIDDEISKRKGEKRET